MSTAPRFTGSTRGGGGRDRPIAVVVLAVSLAFVAVAVAKPWGAPADRPTLSDSRPAIASGSAQAPAAGSPIDSSPPPEAAGRLPPVAITTVGARPLPVAFTTPAQPPAARAWTGLRWQRLAPDDPLGLVTSIARWRHGFVAVGAEPGSTPTPVWTSTDGRTWMPLLFDTSKTFWPGIDILAVAAVPGGLVAVAEFVQYCDQPCDRAFVLPVVSWTSSDGSSWTPHVLPTGWLPSPAGAPPLVASGPAGVLVASAGTGARLAASIDGVDWRTVPATAFPARFELDALIGTAKGYVAAGRWMASNDRSRAAALWSADGQRWSTEPSLLPGPGGGTAALDGTVSSLVAGSGGLIAEGGNTAMPGTASWWHSVDGRTWRSLLAFPPLGPTTCNGEGCGLDPNGSLLGDGTRLVAIRGGPGAVAWVSRDGATWRHLSMTGDVPHEPLAWTVLPGGVLATNGVTSWYGQAITG